MRDVDDESAARSADTHGRGAHGRWPLPYLSGVVCVVSAREVCFFLTAQPPPHSGRAAQGPHTATHNTLTASTARAAGTWHVMSKPSQRAKTFLLGSLQTPPRGERRQANSGHRMMEGGDSAPWPASERGGGTRSQGEERRKEGRKGRAAEKSKDSP